MFSGRMEVLTDADGWILIDRNGKHFGSILNFLRDGQIPLPIPRESCLSYKLKLSTTVWRSLAAPLKTVLERWVERVQMLSPSAESLLSPVTGRSRPSSRLTI